MMESSRDGVLYYSRILKFEKAKKVFKKVFERFYVFKYCPFLSTVVLLKRTTFENLWKTSKRFLKGSRSPEVFQRLFRGFRIFSMFFIGGKTSRISYSVDFFFLTMGKKSSSVFKISATSSLNFEISQRLSALLLSTLRFVWIENLVAPSSHLHYMSGYDM